MLANESGTHDETVLIAVVLHDTLEHTDTTLARLAPLSGQEVAEIVDEATEGRKLPKAERKWLQMAYAARMSANVKLGKLVDKTCTLRDIATCPPAAWTVERKREYVERREPW